jgi:hypothetical protein
VKQIKQHRLWRHLAAWVLVQRKAYKLAIKIPYLPHNDVIYDLFYFSKYALSIYGSIPYNVLAKKKVLDLFKCINEERNFMKNT